MVDKAGLAWLVGLSGTTYRLTCGWQVVIRADWCDTTAGRPWGISYAMILNDQNGHRILGFDNSHGFDGAEPGDAFDHEHRANKVGQRFCYKFVSPQQLMNDFWERMERHCDAEKAPFEFEDDVS